MTLSGVAWWSGGIWGGISLVLILLYVVAELFGAPERSWQQRFRDLRRHLFLAIIVAVLAWPLIVVLVFFQVRRDLILEHACFGHSQPTPSRPTTEQQWLAGKDAARLLAGLPLAISSRKQRLFACACCRRIWDRLSDPRSRTAIELAERLADDRLSQQEANEAQRQASMAAAALMSQGDLEGGAAARACQDCLTGDAVAAARRAAVSSFGQRRREARAQCELLCEIVGNPFRPLPPRSFPAEVIELARACHDGDHGLYPLLADALDELGESAAADHCRQPGHLRGCHVVDWVLGW